MLTTADDDDKCIAGKKMTVSRETESSATYVVSSAIRHDYSLVAALEVFGDAETFRSWHMFFL